MEKHDWSRLTHLQVGRFAEYFVKMEFTLYGFDVYQAEVDDKGIDFVIRKGRDRYFDIQVKSIRGLNYVFFPKRCFELRENLLAALWFSSLPRCRTYFQFRRLNGRTRTRCLSAAITSYQRKRVNRNGV